MYLETFKLPIEQEGRIIGEQAEYNGGSRFGYIDNSYPCGLFSKKRLYEINCSSVTILYGGNGSGKSTLLNMIAEKLKLDRSAPYNRSEVYDRYIEACQYKVGIDDDGKILRIPKGSRIITSDDVFDYMLAIRANNEEIEENVKNARAFWHEVRSGKIAREDNILENFDRYRMTVLARNKNVSRRKYLRQTAGVELKMRSNGETALEYFDRNLKNDKLYCLDEPENSLSPKLQRQLVELLETISHYCGCQLIIATHSPFILAIKGARIYDLDEIPVDIKPWWELENVREYYSFFKENERHFEDFQLKQKANEIVKREQPKRQPLGFGWLTENRDELHTLMLEKRLSVLIIRHINELISETPDQNKEEKAAEIIEIINSSEDVEQLKEKLGIQWN